MSEKHKQMVHDVTVLGKTCKEVAEYHGVSYSTVNRAVKTLQPDFKRDGRPGKPGAPMKPAKAPKWWPTAKEILETGGTYKEAGEAVGVSRQRIEQVKRIFLPTVKVDDTLTVEQVGHIQVVRYRSKSRTAFETRKANLTASWGEIGDALSLTASCAVNSARYWAEKTRKKIPKQVDRPVHIEVIKCSTMGETCQRTREANPTAKWRQIGEVLGLNDPVSACARATQWRTWKRKKDAAAG